MYVYMYLWCLMLLCPVFKVHTTVCAQSDLLYCVIIAVQFWRRLGMPRQCITTTRVVLGSSFVSTSQRGVTSKEARSSTVSYPPTLLYIVVLYVAIGVHIYTTSNTPWKVGILTLVTAHRPEEVRHDTSIRPHKLLISNLSYNYEQVVLQSMRPSRGIVSYLLCL